MTVLVTWNVQCGLGVDGRVDLRRIAETASTPDMPDILCFQEIARGMPELDGGRGEDQVAVLSDLFPDHATVFGRAVDRAGGKGGRRQFGNLILSRLDVLQVFPHLLPQPADPGVMHMPRQALEAVVAAPWGPLRVLTTHLEFHSERQRLAQVSRLGTLQAEVRENERNPAAAPPDGPYARVPRPESALFAGDFNAVPDDDVYARLVASADDGAGLLDAWRVLHGGIAHAPTCGIYDTAQWPQGPHCRDYVFVTRDLWDRIIDLRADGETAASDHQPLRLTLADDLLVI